MQTVKFMILSAMVFALGACGTEVGNGQNDGGWNGGGSEHPTVVPQNDTAPIKSSEEDRSDHGQMSGPSPATPGSALEIDNYSWALASCTGFLGTETSDAFTLANSDLTLEFERNESDWFVQGRNETFRIPFDTSKNTTRTSVNGTAELAYQCESKGSQKVAVTRAGYNVVYFVEWTTKESGDIATLSIRLGESGSSIELGRSE